MNYKTAKMTLYFYLVTRTASSWETAFFDLLTRSDENNKHLLSTVYPELCQAFSDYQQSNPEEFFKEFK